jgi:hypothetical protein
MIHELSHQGNPDGFSRAQYWVHTHKPSKKTIHCDWPLLRGSNRRDEWSMLFKLLQHFSLAGVNDPKLGVDTDVHAVI